MEAHYESESDNAFLYSDLSEKLKVQKNLNYFKFVSAVVIVVCLIVSVAALGIALSTKHGPSVERSEQSAKVGQLVAALNASDVQQLEHLPWREQAIVIKGLITELNKTQKRQQQQHLQLSEATKLYLMARFNETLLRKLNLTQQQLQKLKESQKDLLTKLTGHIANASSEEFRAACPPTRDQGSCEFGWVKGPYGSCYKFVTSPTLNWNAARLACTNMGSYLATLETQEEIIWIRGYRTFHISLRATAFVGGYKNRGGEWAWKGKDGDFPMKVTDWARGQPDYSRVSQDCLSLFGEYGSYRSAANTWFRFDDDTCTIRRSYICEKSYM